MNAKYDMSHALAGFSAFHPVISAAMQALAVDWHPEVPSGTIAMVEIGRALSNNVDCFSTSDLKFVFDWTETLLVEGDEEVKNAVATGLLECLLHEASAGRLDFTIFARHLGLRSRSHCRAWNRFTGCQTEGLL